MFSSSLVARTFICFSSHLKTALSHRALGLKCQLVFRSSLIGGTTQHQTASALDKQVTAVAAMSSDIGVGVLSLLSAVSRQRTCYQWLSTRSRLFARRASSQIPEKVLPSSTNHLILPAYSTRPKSTNTRSRSSWKQAVPARWCFDRSGPTAAIPHNLQTNASSLWCKLPSMFS